ncbi:hypothetical protein [Magnetospirillum sp. SS-4]|uniref:hypothetical protein n=1 Tax=Magnetospirillum sp. SS-4 TaxID=2681465 RepID=UPI0013827485|nr:hypothetical protein [Magnetospirillum sp. SS-4]CAA7613737.1 conserved hypothetical protein [Magnetospirillum sp. SS-4]
MSPSDIDGVVPPAGGLAWRLHELLRGSSDGAGRRLSFLALDPARKHFGHDWPRVSAKVHGIVASTLRSFLSEGDVYSLADEFSYIIISSNRESSDFDKLMEDISSEISSRMVGKGIAKELVSIVHLNSGGDSGGGTRHGEHGGGDSAEMHLGNIERIMNEASVSGDEFSLGSVTYRSFPVLFTGTLATAAYMCLAEAVGEDKTKRYGYDVLPLESDPLLYAEMDALTVEFAARLLKDATDRQMVVQMPVHRTTLSSKKYREMYLKICHGMLANRKDRAIFDVHGIDEGTPSNRISEYMQWLRPYARAIAITVDPDFSMIPAFSSVNALSVGIDLRAVEADLVVQKVGKFIARVKAANMKCHVHGVSSKAQADFCLRLGADYLDSELIADSLI